MLVMVFMVHIGLLFCQKVILKLILAMVICLNLIRLAILCGLKTIPYDGTSVRCRIDFNNPTLLKEALSFNNKIHDPPYDYIERKYGAEGDKSVRINLSERINYVRSREGGKQVRTELENLLRSVQRVIIDFDGVLVISSSFADEVFGRLFVKLGPPAFARRIDFQNTDETADVLIDRAIIQRTQTTQNGNGNN